MNFYFMKTVNIPMYGNSAAYVNYCTFCLKYILYTKMLRIHVFSIFTIKPLNRKDTDKCTLSYNIHVHSRTLFGKTSVKQMAYLESSLNHCFNDNR